MGEQLFYWLTKGLRVKQKQNFSAIDHCSFQFAGTKSPHASLIRMGVRGSSHASDLMPKLCDERRIDVPGHSRISTLLGPSENPEARQTTEI